KRRLRRHSYLFLSGRQLQSQVQPRTLFNFQYDPFPGQCLESARLDSSQIAAGFEARKRVQSVSVRRGLLTDTGILISNLNGCFRHGRATRIFYKPVEFGGLSQESRNEGREEKPDRFSHTSASRDARAFFR